MTTPSNTAVTPATSSETDVNMPSLAAAMRVLDQLEAMVGQLRTELTSYDARVQGGPVHRATDSAVTGQPVKRTTMTGAGAAEASRRYGARA